MLHRTDDDVSMLALPFRSAGVAATDSRGHDND